MLQTFWHPSGEDTDSSSAPSAVERGQLEEPSGHTQANTQDFECCETVFSPEHRLNAPHGIE